jgi:hypothetical protein
MVKYETKALYGGAITSTLPQGLLDASDLRQVPDTQEVFLNPSENTSNYEELVKDDSIIFDLMEALETKNAVDALKEHFAEISTLNDNESNWKLLNVQEFQLDVSGPESAVLGFGLEPALKWGRSEEPTGENHLKPTLVLVLGLVRLSKVKTDVLITYNILFNKDEELQSLLELDKSGSINTANKAIDRINLGLAVVKTAINDFKVESWDLFG